MYGVVLTITLERLKNYNPSKFFMEQEHIEFLKEIGLTKTESKVYLTLLEIGKSLAGTISSRSGIYRKNVYDALEVLSKKGLVVSNIQNNKRYWTCINPERIKNIFEEKLSLFKVFLPELLSKFKEKKQKQTVELYEGIEGIKSFNNLILKENKNLYIIGATGLLFKKLKFSIPYYLEKSRKSKIKSFILFVSNYNKEGFNKIKESKNVKCKILSKEFITNTQLYLFGDYSAINIWSEEPITVVIKSKEISEGFMKYFELMWRIARS